VNLKKILSIGKAKHCVRLFLFSTIIFYFLPTAKAQKTIDNQAFGHFLNLEFEICLSHLPSATSEEYAWYLKSLVLTTQLFLSDDASRYKSSKNMEGQMLNSIEESGLDDVSIRYLQAEVKMQWAILKMKFGEEFKAFWSMRQAYKLALTNLERSPKHQPTYKTMGMLYVLFGVVPDKQQWVLSLFGIDGDVETGISYLEKVASDNEIYAQECNLLLALIHTYLLNNTEEGFDRMLKLHQKERHLLSDYAYALIAMKAGQSPMALQVLQSAENDYEQPFALSQIFYLMAEINLQKGDLQQAISRYEQFVKHQQGLALIKDAYFKLGICHLIIDDAEQADQYFELAKTSGWVKNEADQYAADQLESDHFSHKDLYRLRYATDGGYYKKAADIQSQIKPDSLQSRDLCEYYYRTARLAHKTSKLDEASQNYALAVGLQAENRWYFAPNAELQLAYIEISRQDTSAARMHLENVLDYKGYPYAGSIRQKAKLELKSLE
jgi:tetratricopeptide (TPR) repeat protein